MNPRLTHSPGIYLVGFMGCGKSTVGRRLARRLSWNFFDTDEEIEAAEGTSIADIFARRGALVFRRIEAEMLRQHVGWIRRGRAAVVALGGGAFAERSNREMLRDNGITVWLDCPLDVLKRRVAQASHRPLAHDPERFAALYEARLGFYRLADVRVTVEDDDPEHAVEAVLSDPLLQ